MSFLGALGLPEPVWTLIAAVMVASGVMWVITPFVIFAIKVRLDRLIEAQKQTNNLLSRGPDHPG